MDLSDVFIKLLLKELFLKCKLLIHHEKLIVLKAIDLSLLFFDVQLFLGFFFLVVGLGNFTLPLLLESLVLVFET